MTTTLKFLLYTIVFIYAASFVSLLLLLWHWMNSFVIDPDYSSMFAMVTANIGIITGAIGMPVLHQLYREAKRKDDEYEKKRSEIEWYFHYDESANAIGISRSPEPTKASFEMGEIGEGKL